MQLYQIRGGNEKDLVEKNYNIHVGISLGNKWFTTEKIIELIQWSLDYTKEFVGVVPADDIHAINLEVRKRISSARALRLTRKQSDNLLSNERIQKGEVFSEIRNTIMDTEPKAFLEVR